MMALFNNRDAFSYDLSREGDEVILTIDCLNYPRLPSLEDDPMTMARACDILTEVPHATKIIFKQKRNYEYDASQVPLLAEIARLYSRLAVEKDLIGYSSLISYPKCTKCTNGWYAKLRYTVSNRLKTDPIGAYVELKRAIREEKIKAEKTTDSRCYKCEQNYISVLEKLLSLLDKTQLIATAKPYLAGYKLGDRGIYRRIFVPIIRPDFMYTKLMSEYPLDADEVDSYKVNNSQVTIFELPDTVQSLYHVVPPEFRLSEDQYELLDTARDIMAEHKPTKEEFVDPQRMRRVFFNVGKDLLQELIEHKGIKMTQKQLDELANILVRYTVGFGLIEVLMQDKKVQDITINSPMAEIPIFLVHQDYGDCYTNILPTRAESESWASKLRMISGRPLDEANPILDTELILPEARARVAVISPPLNPTGLAYAFRRHRDEPWTLPLFLSNRMLNPLAAGILSFLIDGSRTMLIAGTRSAGKTSLLGSILTEIMRKYRVITIEDTLELPVSSLRKLGYNIQSMKVGAAMTKGTAEVPADEGIRTTLRMGDSSLIIGEVRSTEAKALYEAMRVGAMANVVAGTIHGDSPYGVFDRVVNDLGVPRTSFKATDIVVVTNPIRSSDGLHRWRRITQITEIRKQWEQDPLLENGFVDLMKYDTKKDELEPSSDLINGESDVLKAIAGSVKEWAGNWDAVWDNILLRAKIKKTMVDCSVKSKMPSMLEAGFVIHANDQFHKISDRIREEVGSLDSKRIFFDWNEWLKRYVKKSRIK